jgi:hypothetical protein
MNSPVLQQTPYEVTKTGFGFERLSELEKRDRFDVAVRLRSILQQSEGTTFEPRRLVRDNFSTAGFAPLISSPEAVRLLARRQIPKLSARPSIFELAPLDLGKMLRSPDADDDVLSEMLDDARF